MKITYESVTGTIEIEVSEHWGNVIAELERREERINRKETRRHERLDITLDESPWLKSEETDPEIAEQNSETEERLKCAMSHLSEKQEDVIRCVFYKGYGITEYAVMRGISQSAATQRLQSAKKKLKKFL